MDSEDEPLLLQAMWDFSEYEEQDDEEEKEICNEGVEVIRGEPGCRGLWWVVGWIYTRPWASGVVLIIGFLLPLTLSAYMFVYCEPLDIDLSYSAFEVRSHSSAERFDALTVALKSQLGSWDRHRRDAEVFDFDSNALRDFLLLKLNKQENQPVVANQTRLSEVLRNRQSKFEKAQKQGDRINTEIAQMMKILNGEEQEGKIREIRNGTEFNRTQVNEESSSVLVRKPRFAGYSYLQTQALWRMELVFVAQGDKDNNIFTPERLHTIHHVERLLMQHPQFQQFCWKPLEVLRDLPLGPSYCSPPSSLLSYLFPSERGGKIYFDGMGSDLADIQGESFTAAKSDYIDFY